MTRDLVIDQDYAEALASDLARKVSETKFKETTKWMVDITQIDKAHIFDSHVDNGTCP